MTDLAKIALKTGLIVGLMAGVWLLFAGVTVPTIQLSSEFINAVSFGKTFFWYWLPTSSPILVTLGLGIITFNLGILSFKLGMLAVKWLMKVNE